MSSKGHGTFRLLLLQTTTSLTVLGCYYFKRQYKTSKNCLINFRINNILNCSCPFEDIYEMFNVIYSTAVVPIILYKSDWRLVTFS